MKTIFTLLVSLVMSLGVFADGTKPKSDLTIKSDDRGDIRVVIDGRRFEPNDNYMRIRGMETGFHNVKIYRERNTGLFSIFGNRYEVVFNSSLRIKPFTNVMITVDRYGRTAVNESRVNGWFGRDDRGYGDRDDRGFGGNDNRNFDKSHDFDYDHSGNFGDYDSRDSKWGSNDRGGMTGGNDRGGKIDGNDRDGRSGGNDRGGQTGGYDGKDYNSGYNRTMSDMEFSRVLQSIDKEWFENNKVKSATQVISTSFFTAAQVKQMLQLFTFESNKLDLAKQAYTKTVDQRNYFMVNDVFSFSSSKDDLARYIRSH